MPLRREEMAELVSAELLHRLQHAPHGSAELWRVMASVETVIQEEDGNALYRWRASLRGKFRPELHGTVRGNVVEACRRAAEALAELASAANDSMTAAGWVASPKGAFEM